MMAVQESRGFPFRRVTGTKVVVGKVVCSQPLKWCLKSKHVPAEILESWLAASQGAEEFCDNIERFAKREWYDDIGHISQGPEQYLIRFCEIIFDFVVV